MDKRILRAMTIAFAGFAVAAPVATAGNSQRANIDGTLREIGAWAVPSKAKHHGAPPQSKLHQQLAEIGAWAVPKR